MSDEKNIQGSTDNKSVSPDNQNNSGKEGSDQSGSQPSGKEDNQQEEIVSIPKKEYDKLRSNAGRARSREEKKKERAMRREERNSKNVVISDESDPEFVSIIKERDTKIQELMQKNTMLEVKDKVQNIINSEDYKDLSPVIKKAIAKNPLGFVNNDSENIDDYIDDIEDFLDDALEITSNSDNSRNLQGIENKSEDFSVPPASPSTPSPSNSEGDNLEGKTGQDRTLQMIKNLFKNK